MEVTKKENLTKNRPVNLTAIPGKQKEHSILKTTSRTGSDGKLSVLISEAEILTDKPDRLLWWNRWLDGQEKISGCYLASFFTSSIISSRTK